MNDQSLLYYEFGAFCLNVTERLLQRGDEVVPLTPKLVDTLFALVENAGHVLTKKDLMQMLWAESFVEESSLTQNIFLLRKALAKGGNGPRYIETISKRGYRFVADVRKIIEAKSETEDRKSLAILPFVNANGDSDFEYFADGITESIINNLSQLPQLKVMARSAVFRHKGSEVDPQKVGRKIGVRAVVTGRVLRHGDVLNIQAELVDVLDGTQLWGEQYSHNSSDIFKVQEEIAKEITEKLRLRLSVEEKERLTKRYTENTEAYQLYLKGCYHWNKRTVDGLEKGIECFEQAIEIDSAYALAYAGKSDCYAFLGDVGLTAISSQEAFSRAREAAREALRIDDLLAEAHLSLGHMSLHYFEWPEAEKEYNRAIELNPNLARAHQWYAYYLLFQGRDDEAIKEAAVGLELDPVSLSAISDMGQILFYARQYDAGIDQYRKVLEMEPNFYRPHLWLGWAYEQKRMYDKASAEFQKARTLFEENTEALASLVSAYAMSGQRNQARSLFAELKSLSERKYVSPYTLAWVCLSLGEIDKAFEWLDHAYQQRAEWMPYLGVDPKFDSLRAHERFNNILADVGFPLKVLQASASRFSRQQSKSEFVGSF